MDILQYKFLLAVGVFLLFGALVAVYGYRRTATRLRQQILELQGQIAAQISAREALERDSAVSGQQRVWLEGQLANTQKLLSQEQYDARDRAAEQARLQTELTHARDRLAEQQQDLITLQDRLKTEFRNLANEILEEKSQKFTQQNQTQLGALLQPLQERIKEYQQRVDTTREKDIQDRTALIEQIRMLSELNRQMSSEARQLTQALQGQSKVQGDWGEMVLERILEVSGLENGINYLTQTSYRDENKQLKRPDAILLLPQGKQVIVDAKVSLTAYLSYVHAEDAETRAASLRQHVESIRNHINELTAKNYQELPQVTSLDFVLMFVPIEAAFVAAFSARPELYEEALRKNIVVVTTTTLLATLKIVKNLWREENQNRNAEEIARQSGLLYDRFVALYRELETLGQRIQSVQSVYDNIIKKTATGKGNLISRANQIKLLGARTSQSMPSEWLDRVQEAPFSLADISSAGEDQPFSEGLPTVNDNSRRDDAATDDAASDDATTDDAATEVQ